jgi:hypothetical protein
LSTGYIGGATLLVGEGGRVGVGLPLGEEEMFASALSVEALIFASIFGAEESLEPHPLQRMKVSNNGSSTISFFIIFLKGVRR